MRKQLAFLASLSFACTFQVAFAQAIKQPPPAKQTPTVKQPQKPDTGKWRSQLTINPMNDEKRLSYILDAEDKIDGVAVSSPMQLLLIETDKNGDNPLILLKGVNGDDPPIHIDKKYSSSKIKYQIRFDKEVAKEFTSFYIEHFSGSGIPSGMPFFPSQSSEDRQSSKKFLLHDTVLIAILGNKTTEYAKFDLRGLKEACLQMAKEKSKNKKSNEI